MFSTMLKKSNPLTISNAKTSMKGCFLFFSGVFVNLVLGFSIIEKNQNGS